MQAKVEAATVDTKAEAVTGKTKAEEPNGETKRKADDSNGAEGKGDAKKVKA